MAVSKMSDFLELMNPKERSRLKTYVLEFHPDPLPSTQLGVPHTLPDTEGDSSHINTVNVFQDTSPNGGNVPHFDTKTMSVTDRGITDILPSQWDDKHGIHKSRDMFSRYLSHVVANFSAELDEQYRPPSVPVTKTIRSDHSPLSTDKMTPRELRKLQRNIRFGKLPTMLLPKARPRVRRDLEYYLRSLGGSGQVVPMDPRISLELSVLNSSSYGLSDVRPLSASSSDSTSILQMAQSSSVEEYLDNYSDVSSVMSWLHRNRQKRSQGDIRSVFMDPFEHVTCPECRRLLMERGILDQVVRDWWKMARKNFQPLPKHNNVRRGVTPHFCNYIKSKELHDREPSTPSTSRPHTPHRYNATVHRATSTTSGRSSGTEGRPSSPRLDESDNDTVEHDIEVPRIKVSRKAPKRADESIHSEPLKSKSNNEAAPGSSYFKASNRHHGHDRSKCSSKSNVRLQADTKKHNAAETKENQQPKPSSEKSTTNGTSEPARSEAPTDPVTADTDSKSSRKGRRQVKKKEKKAFQRQRSAREETPDVVEDPLVQDKPSTPQPTTEDEAPILENPKPNEVEPPRPVPRAPTTKSVSTRRGSKSIISEPSIFKPNITEILEQELRERRFYNFPAMSEHRPEMTQKPISSNWTQGRLALSQQSSRFELPMDMKLLETMKPVEYLSKYCVVTSKRQWLYEKIYLKHKDTKLGGLNLKGLEKALKEALVDTITPEEVTEMIELVQITESSKIDQKLFVGIAAMTERLLYPRFLTEETQNIKDHKKEKIECADFCGLEWKFHGVHVNDSMRKLLESL